MKNILHVFFMFSVLSITIVRFASADPALVLGTKVSKGLSLPAQDTFSTMTKMNQISTSSGAGDVWDISILNVASNLTYGFTGEEVRAFDLSRNVLVGSWPVMRTADDRASNIMQLAEPNEHGEEANTEYRFEVGNQNVDALGCLWDHPLRYGDIDNDGQNELVLYLGKDGVDKINRRLDFVIFSLQKHVVMFSARLARETTGEKLLSFDPDYKNKPNYSVYPQIMDTYGNSENEGAMRYYAKLYFGDFNGDGKSDIIAWRKRYDSRAIGDEVKGYKLTDQLLTYYELNDGVYKAQTTDAATIKAWLASKNLTWQDGYPNVSECPGEEGKPIPETVDPLLNDPDVLQTSTTSSGAIGP